MLACLMALSACGGSVEGAQPEPSSTSTSRPPSSSSSSTTTTTTVPSSTTTVAPATTTAPAIPALPATEPTGRPHVATTPEGLATQLAAAETTIRDNRATAVELADAGHLQQLATGALVDHPEWDAVVTPLLPAALRGIVGANLAAGRELSALTGRPRDTLPAWRIRAPAPADELRRYYDEGEAAFGVPWYILAAVHLTETRMSRIDGLSSAGAQGPMQFLPSTWAVYGAGDISDDHDAILGAARYLAANGAPGDLQNAVFRYNPTQRYVNAVLAYAEVMRLDERAYRGYYGWQVYYATTLGDAWLPVGWANPAPRPVTPADVAT